jgi:hypothetical protein
MFRAIMTAKKSRMARAFRAKYFAAPASEAMLYHRVAGCEKQ